MDYKIEKVSKKETVAQVALSAEEFQAALQKAFEENREHFQVHGFRKGKAPYAMVKRVYGTQVLFEEADYIAINDAVKEIIGKEDLKAVEFPKVEIQEQSEEKGLTFKAIFEVMPEFELPELDGLEVPRHNHPFSEADVDRRLEEMRNKNSRLKSREEGQAAQKGDTVTLDFEGSIDGVPFEGGKAEGYELELGSGQFVGTFEEQVEGMKVGEEKDLLVSFPENYGQELLDGKQATFHVFIRDIKEKEVPQLDDEFASEVSEFETVEELRGDLSRQMKQEHEKHMKDAAINGAIMALVEKTELDVPDAFVERQLDYMVDDMKQRLSQQGFSLESYFNIIQSDEKATRTEMRDNAVTRVKTDLVLEKLVEELAPEAAEEDLVALSKELAETYKMDDDFAEKLLEASREQLTSDVKRRKALDLLVDKVRFVEGEDPLAHEEINL
ncbi:Cell division trigger factor [Clostridiaceae bacterium JG1575]|nr:Cell division trigger factor [Clostridiaceae bacterium JG1575]